MQFRIEARRLTNESTHRPATDSESRQFILEASDDQEAITNFVRESQLELVSFQCVRGRESIATVKKDDSVYLVRVSAA